jgi:hypothetical protein
MPRLICHRAAILASICHNGPPLHIGFIGRASGIPLIRIVKFYFYSAFLSVTLKKVEEMVIEDETPNVLTVTVRF